MSTRSQVTLFASAIARSFESPSEAESSFRILMSGFIAIHGSW